ncbi:RluA family pseudouridine synthase [Gottfriedia solisilvae]|uniref:Pseudouridine synthase n=1 Tax=Gottfriedia solisilvae TaxID=1516104 RepID=A0A8J3AH44_9BACI|nr:RluA family pseudouridine synthase [Gottfriedia solisilvae]GGI14382.1 putative RNA pseudouridine synthase YlyB [Gottfriedia solisilvae]
MTVFTFAVEEEQHLERIDTFITAQNEEWSRSQVQIWLKEDFVLVNGEKVKRNYKVKQGDEISVSVPDPKPLEIIAENIPLEIYYEDSDVIVVNKPRGMVVHPALGHETGTLVNALMYHCKDLSGINGILRPGIVHRIDKDTSGLLMVAKNDVAHEKLAEQLREKTTVRKYIAIVHGVIQHEEGTIDAPIGRDKSDRQSMTVTEENAKEAVTHFKVLERFEEFTLVECQLETGRTHQIRVHMKYIGFPLAGDPKYGPRKTIDIDGQALHAAVLGFKHPRTGEYMEFSSPIPKVMEDVLENLRR